LPAASRSKGVQNHRGAGRPRELRDTLLGAGGRTRGIANIRDILEDRRNSGKLAAIGPNFAPKN
jgi:hypothetical protein